MKPRLILLTATCLSVLCQSISATAADGTPVGSPPPDRPLIDFAAAGAETRIQPTSGQVSVARASDGSGVTVAIQPGNEGYPGIFLTPEEGKWDLSAFGHIEARIVNMGGKPLAISMGVDNKPDGGHRNTESINIEPGARGTIQVIFGYSYGRKLGYALKPDAVERVLLFTGQSKEPHSFRIESIAAGGPAGEKPPSDPNTVRIKLDDGMLFGEGFTVLTEMPPVIPQDAKQVREKFAKTVQVEGKEGAAAAGEGEGVKVTIPKGKGGSITLKPVHGRWDLREALEVRVKVKNTGVAPMTPSVLLSSNKGPGGKATAVAAIAPGQSGEVVVSFIPEVSWRGIKDSAKTSWEGEHGTGTKFGSEAVGGVTISCDPLAADRSFVVESVVAGVPPAAEMPDWLGKRPPVAGDWVQTFQEEFDGDKIDARKWNIYTENYWDKSTHFSKDNVIVADGMATLRYEKKRGFHNDDPKQTLALTNPRVSETDYASGFLDTYGKWVQRYGYFEARMKLPKAEGLWPAMWLMPDRGVAEGPQWKRSSTHNGGMEFDIMEFLSGWGPYRYNIAWHWDGYEKEHQQTGTEQIYFLPDKDGFITAGVLWLPGLSVYYANGREVARWESPRVSTVPCEMMFTHVSGGWANTPLEESALPDDFVIDYVRAWQHKNLASGVDGYQSPPSAAQTK